jgi:hypothetical protein
MPTPKSWQRAVIELLKDYLCQLLNVSVIRYFVKLEKVTLVTSNCSAATNYHALACFCFKPLLPSTSLVTRSSTVRDYIPETYSELELHLFPTLQACFFPSVYQNSTFAQWLEFSLCFNLK